MSDPCNLPVIIGEGDEKLERYYYDAVTGICRVFTYHGMKGNQNNFLSHVNGSFFNFKIVTKLKFIVSQRTNLFKLFLKGRI